MHFEKFVEIHYAGIKLFKNYYFKNPDASPGHEEVSAIIYIGSKLHKPFLNKPVE